MGVDRNGGKYSLAAGMLVAIVGLTGRAAHAEVTLERVEITGSALRRIDGETATPTTVLRRDDLLQRGVTQLEQALAWIGAQQSSIGLAGSVGGFSGGKAEADLRGLAGPLGGNANKTLVLLNGRRLANHAFDGAAVDLYALPMAAVDRIEILHDGASALYGSDAIGGVVNVITRTDVPAVEIAAQAQGAQHGGGAVRRLSLTGGWGSGEVGGLRTLLTADVRQQNRLAALDRPFSRTGVLRGDTDSLTSGTSFPGELFLGGVEASAGCAPPSSVVASNGGCRYDIAREVDAIPANEQRVGLLRSTLRPTATSSLSAEWLWSRHHTRQTVAAAPGFHCIPAGSPFYPAGAPSALVPNLCQPGDAVPLVAGDFVDWREVPVGPRRRTNTTFADRGLIEWQGALTDQWELQAAVGRSTSRSTDRVVTGFADDALIQQGVWDGVINPFGDQTAAGQAAIDAAQVVAPVQTGRTRIAFADLRLRGDLAQLDGGPLALALGVEHRRERASYQVPDVVSALPSLGLDPQADNGGQRQVSALYGELDWPLSRALTVTGSARWDRYSDIGSALNPKLSMRLRASDALLVRGSVGSGFRAPTLYEVHRPESFGFTAGLWDDPALCPGGNPLAGLDRDAVCGQQFGVRQAGPTTRGGSAASVQPEKARNWSLGWVLEASRDWTVSLDAWRVHVRRMIGGLPEQAVLDGNSTRYADRIVRCSDLARGAVPGQQADGFDVCRAGLVDPTAPDRIAYIDLPTENLGSLMTRGYDVSVQWRGLDLGGSRLRVGLDGTWVQRYRYQREPGGASIDAVGRYTDNAPVFRWQHALTAQWAMPTVVIALGQRFKSGYTDQDGVNRVPSYLLHDLSATWQGFRQWTLTAGVQNLFDRAPPQSLQFTTFQSGYDPRYTDPLGRVFSVRAAHRF